MHERSLLEWVASVSQALSGARVGHALAGGLAVAVWARPRATVDMDLVVPTDEESITRAREALAAAGLIQTRRKAVQFKRMGLLRLAIPPANGRETIVVDLLLLQPDLAAEVLGRAEARRVAGVDIPVASAEDTILLKLLRLSDQDRADIKAIAAETSLDRRYLRRWAEKLRVLSRLRSVGLR
jgi:hypothetical protein